MPKIERWDALPAAVRQHLADNQLRLWVESQPEVPEGDWYKDFGSFKVCGHGSYPKTFLLPGQAARGAAL